MSALAPGSPAATGPGAPRVPAGFRVLSELGRGGMGVVHEVRDEQGVVMAMKGLRELRPREILRIKDEFRTLRDVQHPNLCRLGELFEDGGCWYYTMELVPGTDILRWVRPDDMSRSGRQSAIALLTPPSRSTGIFGRLDSDDLPTRTVVGTAADASDASTVASEVGPTGAVDAISASTIAPRALPVELDAPLFDHDRLRDALRGLFEGLAALHRAGLVHRDIKPSNIRVDPTGRVVILDFGVVSAVGRSDAEVVGTPAYMAPEQARGEVSPAVDWYAVGVLLYRAMTGHLPFPATAEGLQLRGHQLPPSPDRLTRDLPADLVALCLHLLAPEPADRAGEAELRQVLGESSSTAPAPLAGNGHWWRSGPGAPFVGRDDELAHLRALAGRGVGATARAVLITGASGMGKTAVVHHFLRELLAARPDTVVLSGRCDQRELVPYNALDGVVDDLARLLARVPALASHRPAGADDLIRLFPVLASLVATADAPLRRDVDRERAAASLADLLSSLAARWPVVLFIDDLHWADADSVALLGDLLAGDDAPPVLVVATARGSAATCPATRAIRIPLDELALRGLDDREVRQLVDVMASDGEAVDAAAIARDAAGHPMFVAELARFASDRRTTGGGLDEALWGRARDQSEPARQLLATVVTARAPIEVAVAVDAAGLLPTAAARAVYDLRSARLVRVSRNGAGDVVEPYHDRVAEAVTGRLTADDRCDLHRALATALAARDAVPERLAYHLSAAGDREAAAVHAERAARRAAATFAYDRAAEWYTMALDGGQHDPATRRGLLVARAEMLERAGRPGDAAAVYLDAAAGADLDAIEAMDLRRRSFGQYLMGGYLDEGIAVANELLDELDLSLPTSRTRLLGGLLWNRWRTDRSRLEWTPRTVDQVDARDLLRIDACWSATAGLTLADAVRAAAYSARLPAMCLASGEPTRIARAFAAEAYTAAVFHQRRRLVRMEAAIERAFTESSLEEVRFYRTLASTARAFFFDSDLPAAARLAEHGRDQWRASRGELGWEADMLDMMLAWARLTTGEYGAVRRHVGAVVRSAQRTGNRLRELGFRCQFPHQHLVVDRPDEAAADVDDAFASWHVPDGLDPVDNVYYWTTKGRTAIALYRGADADDDGAALEDAWRQVESTLLVRIPAVRQEISVARGHWRLARARQGGGARRLLAGAARDARHLRSSGVVTGPVNAALIEAGIAEVRGDRQRAVAILGDAIPALDGFGMIGPAAAARWILGRAVGGSQGEALRSDADHALRALGATRPERLVHVYVGGWER